MPAKISKRTPARTTCKDCGRPVLARGMCNGHYQAWRRAHPQAVDKHDTAEVILAALPATRLKIEAATGFTECTVLRHLPKLRKQGKVFIIGFEPPDGAKRWKPIYARGNKKDAVLTTAMKKRYAAEQQAAREAACKASGQPIVLRTPPSKWDKPVREPQGVFAALGVA